MYIKTGISLRKLAKKLKKFFNVKASHKTIRQWIKIYDKPISHQKISASTRWHTVETYIKIKGIGHWLWIIRCRETSQVLCWRISKIHTFDDTKKVMQEALNICLSLLILFGFLFLTVCNAFFNEK